MNGLINFFKDIMMIGHVDDGLRVGLSQFKTEVEIKETRKEPTINTKNVKLSDLMRRAN